MRKASYLTVLSLGLIFAACNNKDNKKEVEPVQATTPSENTVNTSDVADEGVAEIVLKSDDRMRFDQSEIRVKEGQEIRLTLEHIGTMPKSAMGHNFVLIKQGVNLSEFGNAAAKGKAPDYELPDEVLDDVIAHTKMIGGGESVTIEFSAPPKGIYEFLCTFPGHYAIMKGIFIVE